MVQELQIGGTSRHAEIAGAGFAGLTAACALAQRGWSVRVHERADALRTTGAGIYIYENGLRVLETLGAYDAAVKGAPFAHTREVRDDQNRDHLGAPLVGQPGVFDRAADRHQRACRAARGRRASRSSPVRRRCRPRPTARLTLADGRALKADLVVAADGTNSRLRDSLGLLSKRKALVDGCTRLLIAQDAGGDGGQDGATTIEYWSGSRRVLYTPCSETEVYIALTMLDRDEVAKAVPVRRDAWTRWFPHLAPLIERLGEGGRYDRFE